jgi:hypothetical protein
VIFSSFTTISWKFFQFSEGLFPKFFTYRRNQEIVIPYEMRLEGLLFDEVHEVFLLELEPLKQQIVD